MKVGPGGPTGDAPPYGVSSAQLLVDAKAASTREEFEEKIRQFNETLAWEKQRYQSDTAMNLLSTAAQLHGQPRDWQKYAQYTQGGQDIFQRIWGSSPAAAFSAPTGISQPITLADIIARLSGGNAPTSEGASLTREQALDIIWAKRPDLAAFYAKNGWKVGTPEEQRKVVLNWLTIDAGAKALGSDPIRYVTSQGWAPAAAASQAAPPQAAAPQVAAQQTQGGGVRYDPNAPEGPVGKGPYPGDPGVPGKTTPRPGPEWPPPGDTNPLPGGSTGTAVYPGTASGGKSGSDAMAPLPFQMNPLVWDSLSDTAKQMILGAVEAGKTPSGVWTATDWLAQFNASRPKGTAPRSVNYNYGAPRSYF